MSKFRSHSNAAAGGDSSRSTAADMLAEGQDRQASAGIEQARTAMQTAFYNHEGEQDLILDGAIRGKIETALQSGRYRAIMPMYRDMAAVDTVKYMIEALGDPKRAVIVNGGSPEDEVAKVVEGLGAEVLHVGDLRRLIPTDVFYDMLCWNERDSKGDLKVPVGKGMSIFWLHLYDEIVRDTMPEETVTLQIDSDITNIGCAPDKYNPLYYLALPWVIDPDKGYVHAKTSSPGRTNEAMMSVRNALQALADAGLGVVGVYALFTQRIKWMLTGEFGFGNRSSIRNMPHSSGYGAETILVMYLALLNEKRLGDTAQVAIRIPRVDASNTYEKEFVMLDQLAYLMCALAIRPSGNGGIEAMTDLDSLTLADVKEINSRMAKKDYFTILGEDDGPCGVVSTVNDRIIPSIAELERQGCIDTQVVKELKG